MEPMCSPTSVGPYKLKVEANGFEIYVQSGIHLHVSDNPTINVTLHVGEVKQQVEVTASANMVQTQTTSVSAGYRSSEHY